MGGASGVALEDKDSNLYGYYSFFVFATSAELCRIARIFLVAAVLKFDEDFQERSEQANSRCQVSLPMLTALLYL